MQSVRSIFDRRAFLGVCARVGIASTFGSAVGDLAWGFAAADSSSDLARDPLRPQYHLLPPHGWMNDPNGPIWWKGRYHLFYQMNPNAAVWGDMHWGHAISTDMVHWRHEPIALAPTPGGPDSAGCFSGSAVVFQGVPTILYTGVEDATPADATIRDGKNNLRETQMLATAEEAGLLHWKKAPMPVIAAPPQGMAVTGFRDPCPWREADGWYLGVGSGVRGEGGCVLLYRSQDLRHWEYLHPLIQGAPTGLTTDNPVGSGDMWECPDFFELDGQHCLLYSTEGKVYWTTGTYDKGKHHFTPARRGVLDHGAYYAPKSFLAPGGRRILWGWIRETRPEATYVAAGWAGAMSLPRLLGVDVQGRLTMQAAPEVQRLREAPVRTVLQNNVSRQKLGDLRQEIELRTKPAATRASVRLLVAGNSVWELTLDFAAKTVQCGQVTIPMPAFNPAEPALRIFLDASVIESFICTTQAITSRCYELLPDQTEIEFNARGNGGSQFTHWPLQVISPDRMTT